MNYLDYYKLNYKFISDVFEKKDRRNVSNYANLMKFSYVECVHPKSRKLTKMYDENAFKSMIDYNNKSPKDKSKVICMIKYGVENVNQLESWKNKMSKSQKENAKERADKRKITNMKKYGTCDFVNGEKAKETKIKKYGSIENYNKIMAENKRNRLNNEYETFCKDNDCSMFRKVFNPYVNHTMSFLENIMNDLQINLIWHKNVSYIKNKDISILQNEIIKRSGNGFHKSNYEIQLQEFIKSLNINDYVFNNRSVLNGKELDVYIPSKKVAVEFDGLYYHSELFLDKNYHYNKTVECEKQNIRLIHIFEDEWLYKQDIIKSIIKSSLGIYERKIFARKCEIRELNNDEFRQFLTKNHLQGFAISKYRYGLFYNDELVQCIGIGKPRFDKNMNENSMELIRVCTKINTQVVGGFSKLLKYSELKLNYKNLISYIYRRVFNGKGYVSSGFEIVGETKPNYMYTKNQQTFNKMNFRKEKIKEKFLIIDVNFTEDEIMKKLGYLKIYDCGTLKVIYRNKK